MILLLVLKWAIYYIKCHHIEYCNTQEYDISVLTNDKKFACVCLRILRRKKPDTKSQIRMFKSKSKSESKLLKPISKPYVNVSKLNRMRIKANQCAKCKQTNKRKSFLHLDMKMCEKTTTRKSQRKRQKKLEECVFF